jgi:hypothetical protein
MMRNMRRRLHKLERLPQLKPLSTASEQIENCALRQLSNEDLGLMKIIATDVATGVAREISERELKMLAAHNAVREAEAQRMGFRSFAEAERRGRR